MSDAAVIARDLHPIFAGILDDIESSTVIARRVQREAYIRLLQSHEFAYEFSDDHKVWMRGADERAQLRILQREVDPSGALWNQHAPAGYRLPGVLA